MRKLCTVAFINKRGTFIENMEPATNSLCKTKQVLELKGVCHSFSYCQESHMLLLCDSFNWTIEQYTFSTSGLSPPEAVEFDQSLSNPTCVHIAGKMGAVFVGCDSNEGVYVFDCTFQLIKIFAQNMKMDFNHIAVTDEAKDQIEVYMTSVNSDKLTKWDYKSGAVLGELSVTKPENITHKDDKLYLICRVDSTECVLVVIKNSLKIFSKIIVNCWFSLGGLCIDESCNVITSACRVVNGSQRRSILTVDDKGDIILQVMLDFDEHTLVSDMVVVENDLIMLTYEPGPEFNLKTIVFK